MKLESSSHETPNKSWAIKVIDSFIVITVIAALIYTYGMNSQLLLKVIVTVLLLITIGWLIVLQSRKVTKQEDAIQARINKLVLLDEEGESLKEWYIQGVPSLLIGKNSTEQEVDIDLSDVEYASLISKEHAVLNSSSGSWYLEDIESQNGVGVRKIGERATNRLEIEEPYEIGFGDVIYIANTRLLVK